MSDEKDPTFEKLVRGAIDGDMEARALLLVHPDTTRILDKISARASATFHVEADEIKGILLDKLFNKIGSLKLPSLDGVSLVSQFEAWCYQVARHYCMNLLRHSSVAAKHATQVTQMQSRFGKWRDVALPPHHAEPSPEDQLLFKEKKLIAKEITKRLRRELQRTDQSSLKIWESWSRGKSLPEIARETDLPISSVNRKLKGIQKAIVSAYSSEIDAIIDGMKSSQLNIQNEKKATREILRELLSS